MKIKSEFNKFANVSGKISANGSPTLGAIGGMMFGNSTTSGFDAINPLGAASGVGSFSRDWIVYEAGANSVKNPTNTWLDDVNDYYLGVDVTHHRQYNHNPIDFLNEYLYGNTKGLSINDYLNHAWCDVITDRGLPILPERIFEFLTNNLKINATTLARLTNLSIFDVSIGSLSFLSGGHTFFLAITGNLPWQGTETLLLTFGSGILKIAGSGILKFTAGVDTINPLLIAGGALDIGAGAISYFKHLHMPAVTIPDVSILMNGLYGGIAAGSLVSVLRIGLAWNDTSISEKVALSGESIGISSVLGMLSKISPWISIPLGLTYGFGKFAWDLAQKDFEYWRKSPVSSDISAILSLKNIYDIAGEKYLRNFINYIKNHNDLYPMNQNLISFLEAGKNY